MLRDSDGFGRSVRDHLTLSMKALVLLRLRPVLCHPRPRTLAS
jgi:hypothetical protein